ncbi:tripartite tricarboxylate transporter TctB family protein [Ureibacillus chungkukjangi]|uniref:Tripartite tricarboxylate transporter TctB family protein n=1 Tax=Ureibacillus chungkukjangi TaxID=1202712 RepID=A0A318TGA4_9BACL|nr:tripartite tricarboxylate transporter TctB family protein [Ureibacillus chungkukjangi]MCM3388210.1 tripartite tricarboxylate transporter TctB family protein [Ureibacillus chungkukjangi]PYF03714.1 tripartite tricarboxylate transporter TctB family protein [Ureibacillus chungkukjangi]
MTFKLGNIIFSVAFLSIGFYFLIDTFQIQNLVSGNDVGPRAFPLLVAIGLIIFSGINLMTSIFEKNIEKLKFQNFTKVVLTMVGLVIFLILISAFNFYIASIIMIPILLWINDVRKVTRLGFSTVITIAFIFVVFDFLLGIPIP